MTLLAAAVSPSWAQERIWNTAVLTGVYQPVLSTLNDTISRPELAILQDPNHLLPGNPRFPSTLRNLPVPAVSGKQYYGLEFTRRLSRKSALVFTLSTWQGETFTQDIVPFLILPVQPLLFTALPRETRYNVTVNQLWLGWRYYLMEEPRLGRLYVNLQFIGVALGFLTVDTLLKVITPERNFGSVSSTEAQGVGYTTRLGGGGEYFFARWLSVGFQTNVVIGKVPKLVVVRHFPVGFPTAQPTEANVLLQPPPNEGVGVTFAAVVTETPVVENCLTPQTGQAGPCDAVAQNLPLELDGFEVVAALRFHF